jgi:hypothetical protein
LMLKRSKSPSPQPRLCSRVHSNKAASLLFGLTDQWQFCERPAL